MKKKQIAVYSALTVLLLLAVLTCSTTAASVVGGDSLTIIIESSPSGATATYSASGDRWSTPGNYTIHSGTQYWGVPSTIIVTKSGYIPYYINISSSDFGSSSTLRFYVTLTPDVPSTGTLSVSSNPSGAAVYIDGSYRGNSPLSMTLTEGTHSVSIRKDGYDSWSSTARVVGGTSSTISATLNKIVKTGYLSVSSSPSGANVFINNVYRGSTPVNLNLAEGYYTLELRKSGYSTYTTSVSVVGDRTSFVTASLSGGADVQFGYISVKATPAGASMYVDGVFIGNAPSVTGLTAGPFTTGKTLTLLVSADGYQSGSTSFVLSPGETKNITMALTPQAVQTATLYVTSSPSNAAVYIDNVYYGMTPATIPSLQAGSHVLKLNAQNYNEWQEAVSLTAGQTLEKSVSLSPNVPAPPKTPAPMLGLLAGMGVAAVLLLRRK